MVGTRAVREPPFDFDWVTERSGCTADNVFEVLRGLTAANVDRRNALLNADRFSVYVVDSVADYTFAVRDTRADPQRRRFSSFRLAALKPLKAERRREPNEADLGKSGSAFIHRSGSKSIVVRFPQ